MLRGVVIIMPAVKACLILLPGFRPAVMSGKPG